MRTDEEGVRARNEYNLQENKQKLPNKDVFIDDFNNLSLSKIAKKYNVSVSVIKTLVKEYNLSTTYFDNQLLRSGMLDNLENVDLTYKELSIKYNTDLTTIKLYKKIKPTKRIYTNQQIKDKIIEYKLDLNNKGVVKQIMYGDIDLYNSIINNTSNHFLFSDKLTERIYRIVNDYKNTLIIGCKYCNTPLSFTTFSKGYGASELNVCKECTPKQSGHGVSIISQKIFYQIYNLLKDKNNCYFNNLNKELHINITKDDKIKFNHKLNTKFYRIDFAQNNKIIEFDGDYWHRNTQEKDILKKLFLKYKGYNVLRITENEYNSDKELTINKCISFLKD